MKIDLHTHSIASGHAINTIDELIKHAASKGLTHLGITEHGPSMEGAPHAGYFWVSDKIPKKVGDLYVYAGVEANIIDVKGSLDLEGDVLTRQRIVSAGLHERTPYSGQTIAENTEATVGAISSGKCQVITHPIRAQFPVDVGQVAEAALANHVLLELNNQAFSGIRGDVLDMYAEMIRILRAAGGYVIIGSDSHTHFTLGDDSNIIANAGRIHLSEEMVINNYPEKLEEYLPHEE